MGKGAAVTISVHGGGLTAGKFHVSGHGDISNVYSIKDVYGSYAQASASSRRGESWCCPGADQGNRRQRWR